MVEQPQSARVAATSGAMSTELDVLDHAHESPSVRVFAPITAVTSSGCPVWVSFFAMTASKR
jgi:hypothetical protein